ncbi:unnamed protein product [Caretta caretta]
MPSHELNTPGMQPTPLAQVLGSGPPSQFFSSCLLKRKMEQTCRSAKATEILGVSQERYIYYCKGYVRLTDETFLVMQIKTQFNV